VKLLAIYISLKERMENKKRIEALLNRLKSVHLSLTARQLSLDLGGCKVDLH